MLKLAPQSYLIESLDELPEIQGNYIVADAETTSGDHTEKALNPRHGHRVCGWAVCGSEGPAYYVSIRSSHPQATNLDPVKVSNWLKDQIYKKKIWVNHNVKFDAHFLDVETEPLKPVKLVCTLALAKLLKSESPSHGLKYLMKHWLKMDVSEEDEVKNYLEAFEWHDGRRRRKKSKDYGVVPMHMLGRYACKDVIGTRELYIRGEPKVHGPWETEQLLTWRLFEMERRGIRVNVELAEKQKQTTVKNLITLIEFIESTTKRPYTGSSACLHDIFVDMLGLPILAWTKNEKVATPSFDSDSLALYAKLPEVTTDPEVRKLVKTIMVTRKFEQFLGLFLNPILSKNLNGIIHASYNQNIRTGRMSCKEPNLQQMNKAASSLFIPRDGYELVCADASQLEFRLIVHHCNIKSAIQAYNNDPTTDFHALVAALCGVDRDLGKTINFATAYGAGDRKILQTLISVLAETMSGSSAHIRRVCEEKATNIFETYHLKFPEIKRVSKDAARRTRARGYSLNAYGRRRNLPPQAAHRAFNTAVQGGAMDMIKERMVTWQDSQECYMVGNRHDENIFEVPIDSVPEQMPLIKAHFEDVTKFTVPIIWQIGHGKTWLEAKP